MPSLSPKDRISLCLFTYEDHRRCRTPRIATHPHFCFYHAQKESQSQSTEKLAKELSYFFSGDYLSANDLNTALGRLIPAVVRGEIKPRIARTVAYMLQTLMQSTRQAQHEYINAFSTDGWRDAVRTSVKANHDHLYPPDPDAVPDPEDDSDDELNLEDEPVQESEDASKPQQPTATPVGAGLARPASPTAHDRTTATPTPSRPQQPPPPPQRPSPADTEAALAAARCIFPPHPNTTPPAASPPQPQPPTPNRDPFEVHFPHTSFRVDGKRW